MSKTITIGPYHPFLLEPEQFELQVEDDKITEVKVTLGYVHRGIEQLLTTKTYRQGIFLAERVCGICSNAHTLAFSQTVEKVMGIEAPERARYIRAIAAEAERLHSHYLWLALLAHAVGEAEYFLRTMKEREVVVDILERMSGNRTNYAMNTVGGARRDLSPDLITFMREGLDRLKALSEFLIEAVEKNGVLGVKVAGLGVVSGEEAVKLGAVGPTLRGSGVASDARKEEPQAAYPDVNFNVITEKDGDVRARSMVRARETLESISIILQSLDNMSAGPIVGELKAPGVNEGIGRVEAPRGELFYFVKSNGTSMPERIKVRTPTYANIYFLTAALKGEKIENLQPIVESIDPCFSCTDR